MRTTLLRRAADFAVIRPDLTLLRQRCGAEEDVFVDPLHFLAGADEERRPCAVACWRGQELVGVVYATEHGVAGVGTGYAVSGDFSGRGGLLCRAGCEPEVIRTAVRALFAAGIHSLHLRMVPRTSAEMELEGLRGVALNAVAPGDRMELAESPDAFLGRLGKHTRRNVRYYTRKAAEAGIGFDACVAREETGVDAPGTALARRNARLLELHGGGERMGLRDREGRLVASLRGFAKGRRFYLLTQWNDAAQARLSLSLVLRGYLVEWLIARGFAELVFVGGTSLMLGRFCPPQAFRSLLFDRRDGVAAVLKGGLARYCRWRGAGKEVSTAEMLAATFLDEALLRRRTPPGAVAVVVERFGVGQRVRGVVESRAE